MWCCVRWYEQPGIDLSVGAPDPPVILISFNAHPDAHPYFPVLTLTLTLTLILTRTLTLTLTLTTLTVTVTYDHCRGIGNGV